MNKTKIEWVKNPDGTQGYTWNPITGCLNHNNGLCKGGNFPCYAYKLVNTRLFARYVANENIAPIYKDTPEYKAYEKELEEKPSPHTVQYLDLASEITDRNLCDPFYPRFWPERLEELHRRNRTIDMVARCPESRGVFVCDMSDLFGIGISEVWTSEVLNAIDMNEGHDRFYLLTKQPQNLARWSPFPENVWVGLTVTHEGVGEYNHGCEGAITSLEDVEAKVKFISFEPLLSRIYPSFTSFCNWIIIGQQTPISKKTEPKVKWIREIVEAADMAGIPVFLKDNLGSLLLHNELFKWALDDEWALRQEFPPSTFEAQD